MISYLIGQPRVMGKDVTILVHGVGYGVMVGPATLLQLSGQDEAELFIYTFVREDRLELYGFPQPLDKDIFLLLLSVSGVGPKTAQQIVDGRSMEVITAVQQANTGFFSSVPRVGKKLAQKIIIELRTKLGELKSLDLTPLSDDEQAVKEALLSLGFHEARIDQVLRELPVSELGLEKAVKQGITLMGK